MASTPSPPLPYDFLPSVASLSVTSADIEEGGTLPNTHRFGGMGVGGQNRSPHLRWEGAPPGTKSIAVTCLDPDAPTGSGFWHWVLFDLPATVTELPTGAGAGDGLPAGAVHARNDFGSRDYAGAAPPEGAPPHRYVFAVHALDCERLGLDEDASPALVGFYLTGHTLARGLLVATYGR